MVQDNGLAQALPKEASGPVSSSNWVSTILIELFYSKPGDTTNFTQYPDSDKQSPEVAKKDDPFLDW
jgi:hypothetical protein